ncbi:hypothetical protein ACFSQP_02335 [Bizionia sediminis]|uniref:Uncharacterized protein n=1 Tax=Bizionia sediminis TaxID=1737064 RepID=A0ABW5KNP5_9FLAO
MKKIITLVIGLMATTLVAQDTNYNISLGAYIPNQVEGIPDNAKAMLLNKLGQLITSNGISDDVANSRFIITPNITVMSKDVIGSAPTKIALNLEMTLYIGDGIAGNLFATESFTLKSVGNNETKAYMQAIKQLKPSNKKLQDFISNGKAKIIDYYNSNCKQLLAEAAVLENQNNYEGALAILVSVPSASDCFNTVKNKIESTYQKVIDTDCKLKLQEAEAIWVANQDIAAAKEAGYLLASVDPQANCFKAVKNLFSKIEKRVNDLQDRDWDIKLQEFELRKATIEAARAVGVAYGNNQPNTVYNVRGWY